MCSPQESINIILPESTAVKSSQRMEEHISAVRIGP